MQPPQPLLDVLEPRLLLSDGDIDTSFAGHGRFTDDQMTAILDMAVQKDSKVVAVGYENNATGSNSNTVVARFNKDGTLDAKFGQGGRVTIDFGRSSSGRAVAIAADGDIIVAGGVGGAGSGGVVGSDIALARLTPGGVLDPSFSRDGRVVTDLAKVASTSEVGVDVGIDGEGRIVVGAHRDSDNGGGWALVRYRGNGARDGTFGNAGIVSEMGGTLNAIEVLGDGRVLAAGELDESCSGGAAGCSASTAAIVRYTAGGARDASFGAKGAAVNSIQTSGQERVSFSDIAMQGKKIVAVGLRQTQSETDVIAARFSGGGVRDNTFAATPRPLAGARTVLRNSDVLVKVQPDDKIIIGFTSSTLAGRDQKFTVARLRKSGGLDDSFNPRGRLTSTSFVGGIVTVGDGVIIIGSFMTSAGGTNVDDVTNLRDGLTNITFDDQLSTLHSLALQGKTGRIIAGGRAFDLSPGNPELGVSALAALEGFEDVAGPDTKPPRAILQTTHPETEGTNTELVVRYIDDRELNKATIDSKDVVVTGPNGFRQTAKLVRTGRIGDDIEAVYRISAPGGTWNRADEGRYTITLKGHQVADAAGNFAPEKELGRFRVDFSPLP